MEGQEKKPVNWFAGKQYDDFVRDIREVSDNLPKFFPHYKNQGYETAGFVWWQGHKDQALPYCRIYQKNLVRLIKVLQEDFKVPKLYSSWQPSPSADGNSKGQD